MKDVQFRSITMKLAVVGGRDFDNFSLLNEIIWTCFGTDFESYHATTIVSGGAKGADFLAKRWAMIAKPEGIEYVEFLPNWNKYGKVAGFIRNQQIVDACDAVLAFWDGKSRGTKDTIDKAAIAKKPIFIVYY